MKAYYISNIVGAQPGDALKFYESENEAVQGRDSFRKEILEGTYDNEWEIEPEEREQLAKDVEAYKVEYTSSGAIRHNTML